MKITIAAKSNIQYENLNRTWKTYNICIYESLSLRFMARISFKNKQALYKYIYHCIIMTFWHFDASSNSVVGGHCVKLPFFLLGEEPHVQLFSTSTNPNTSNIENTFCKDTPHCSELSLLIPWIQRHCACVSKSIPLKEKESLICEGILCFQRTPRTCCGLPQRRSSESSKTNHYPRKKIRGRLTFVLYIDLICTYYTKQE